ncbi:MAG: hypothetical protein ACT4P4_24885 [Betaproteobacteria bacterium]
MFRIEMRMHAQDIFSRLLAQWATAHQRPPSAEEAGGLARQSLEFARIFFDAAEPKE